LIVSIGLKTLKEDNNGIDTNQQKNNPIVQKYIFDKGL
jgi:hypothetical protein